MAKTKIYIAVAVPPGALSTIQIDWDLDEKKLKNRCNKFQHLDCRMRVEIISVEIDTDEAGT